MNKFSELFGSSIENIKTKYNFLTKQEHAFILNYLNTVNKTKPKEVVHYRTGDAGFEIPIDIYKMSVNIKKRIMQTASEMYGTSFVEGPNPLPLSFTIHSVGSTSDPHTDVLEKNLKPQESGDPELPNWRSSWDGYLACNIYINDNYSGGEVYFPEINYEIKPIANSLVMWAGNENYIHGVKDPISANRYTWTTWIKFEDFDQYC